MPRKTICSCIGAIAVSLAIVMSTSQAVTVDTTELGERFKLHTLTGEDVPIHLELSGRPDGSIILAGFRPIPASGNQATVTVISVGGATVTELVDANDVADLTSLGLHTVSISPNGQKIGASDKVYDLDDLGNPIVIPQIVGAVPVTRVVYEVANDGSAALVVGTTSPGHYNALHDLTTVSDFPPDPDGGAARAIDASGTIWAGALDAASKEAPSASMWTPDHSFLPVSDGSVSSEVRSLSPNGLEAVGFEVLSSGNTVGMWWSSGERSPLFFDDGAPFEGMWFGATDTQVLGGTTEDGRAVIYAPSLGSVTFVEDFVLDQTGVLLDIAPTEVYDVSESGDSIYLGLRGSEHVLQVPLSVLVVPDPGTGAISLAMMSALATSYRHRPNTNQML